jgi:hypothetical protein
LAGLIELNVVILLNSLEVYFAITQNSKEWQVVIVSTYVNLLNAKDIPIKLNKKLKYL